MAIGEVTIFSSLCFIILPWTSPVLRFLFPPSVLPTMTCFWVWSVPVGTFFAVAAVSLSSPSFGRAVGVPQGSSSAPIAVSRTLPPSPFFSLLILIYFISFLLLPSPATPFLPFLPPCLPPAASLVVPSPSEAFIFLQLIEDCFIFLPQSAFSALLIFAFRGLTSLFPCRVAIAAFRFGLFIHIWTPSITYRFLSCCWPSQIVWIRPPTTSGTPHKITFACGLNLELLKYYSY